MKLAIDWNALDWQGTQDEPRLPTNIIPPRMIAAVTIGDVMFHVEAVQVSDIDDTQTGASALGEEQLNILFELTGGGRFQTTKIRDADYVVFITPYS